MALLMYAALFGSLFLVTQLLQTGLDATPWEAGLRMLPMVVMPMLLAPVGGVLADRWGSRPLMIVGRRTGRRRVAGIAAGRRAGGRLRGAGPGDGAMGAGSALFFAPVAATVLGAVAPTRAGHRPPASRPRCASWRSSSGSPYWPRSSPGTAT